MRPKLKTQSLISNSVGAKFSHWHLGINYFWLQLGYLSEMSRCHLRITSFWRQLGSSLGLKIPGDSFSGITLCFIWHLGTNSFWRQLGSLLEFIAGTSELIPFGSNSDLSWDWGFLEIPYRGFLFASPVGVYYAYPFVGNYTFPRWGFTKLLLSWGTTSITKSTRFPTFPSTQFPTMYTYQT